jgi:thiol peroxidase
MNERKNVITSKGNPLTLVGNEIKVGDVAPDFTVIDNGGNEVKCSSIKGDITVISVVMSLDTGLCDLQTKRFNKEAEKLGSDVKILTISMDLPFAQKRWCGTEGVTNVQTVSDHRDASFGTAYGLLIKELRLLARAVFVIDKEGIIQHAQIVSETSEHPHYDAVLEAVRKLK